MQKLVQINKIDTVAVALTPLCKGEEVSVGDKTMLLKQDIPQGHKVCLQAVEKGQLVYKYGYPIGEAKTDIEVGEWVHTHNIQTSLSDLLEYSYEKKVDKLEMSEDRQFMGYKRTTGKVGVRNEIWIIPTVGCLNSVVQAVEREAKQYIQGSIDDICAFTHPYGCSQLGEDQENTRKILADLIGHPNAGGVLVMGLGCENSNIEELKKYLGDYDEKYVRFLVAQDCEDEKQSALALIKELSDCVGVLEREPISCKELIIGMKCGGSDGLSGITANPTVGAFSDILISKGGTTILTEVPEMFGAETILMNRCDNEEVFEKAVKLINNFKEYFIKHDQVIYENPSPGNKAGGISTLEDKSLGCTQKSGTAPVKDVIAYGETVCCKGLNLLSAPGNDLVAATALAAAGAQIVLFTTGRGTPFSCPVPTIKLSTNSQLNMKKRNWIDFNCGQIVEGETIENMGGKLFDYVINVASGEKVKAEKAGYKDMAIFKQGVTL